MSPASGHPADGTGLPRPRDAGFGTLLNNAGAFGNGTFNTPSLIEAADTGPLFHNNAVNTIEDAVAFYGGPTFNASPAGLAVGGIELTSPQVIEVAAFLRVLNALENVRSSSSFAGRAIETIEAMEAYSFGQGTRLILLAIHDLDDAISVLQGGSLSLSPQAVADLTNARDYLSEAKTTKSQTARKELITQAIGELDNARTSMVQVQP